MASLVQPRGTLYAASLFRRRFELLMVIALPSVATIAPTDSMEFRNGFWDEFSATTIYQ